MPRLPRPRRNSLPSDWTQRGERNLKTEKSIQHFFRREEWEKAVKEENIQLFKPGPVPTSNSGDDSGHNAGEAESETRYVAPD